MLYLAVTILVIVLLAVDKIPEYKPLLITSLIGLVFASIAAAFSVYKMGTLVPKTVDPSAPIKFSTCPDYWTEVWDNTAKKRMCYNYQFDDQGKENLFQPYQSPPNLYNYNSQNAMLTLDLTNLNTDASISNEARCKIAKSHPWTEAYNLCYKYPANAINTITSAGVKYATVDPSNAATNPRLA
jgi:hypothetical protein